MKLGFDISHWQAEVDFNKAKESGIEFAFIKAGGAFTLSLGLYKDSYFDKNASNSLGVIPRGFYWYFVPQAGGKKQAQYFKYLVENYKPELPCVVDVEYKGLTSQSYNLNQLEIFLAEFDTIIYTSKYAWDNVIGTAGNKNIPLWVASYPYTYWFDDLITNVKEPLIPNGWTDYNYWQFTEKAPGKDYGVSSAYVDLDFAKEVTIEEPIKSDNFKLLSSLNIRTRPYVSSSTYITTLPQGSIVRAYDIKLIDQDEWLLCRTGNDTVGWMAMRYNNKEYMEML